MHSVGLMSGVGRIKRTTDIECVPNQDERMNEREPASRFSLEMYERLVRLNAGQGLYT